MDEHELRNYQSSNVDNIFSTLKTIEINLINNCNRSCLFCPHGDTNYKITNGRASSSLFFKLYNQLSEKNFQNRISFCGFGEPTLHKDLTEFSRILSPLGCTIEVVTNGDLLDEKIIEEYYESGITIINVSIYEKESLERISKLFLNINKNRYLLRKRFKSFDLVNRIEILENNPIEINYKKCHLPSYKLFLDYNGNVLLCCNDWNRDHVYGNIYEKNIYDIWIESLKEKRFELISGIRKGPCATCNVQGTRYGKDSVDFFIKNSQ